MRFFTARFKPLFEPSSAASTARPWAAAAQRGAAVLALGAGLLLAPLGATAQTTSGANDVQRLVGEGKHAQALKVIDEALGKSPKDPQLQFQRGVVLSMLNRRPEALEAFKKLVAENPTMAPAYNNMAVIYAAMSDYENAKASLDKAIRISPDYATAYQNLGDVYVQFASQAYQKSLSLDKTDPGVAPKLALLQDVLLPPAERSTAAKAGAKGATAVARAGTPLTAPVLTAPVVTAMAPAVASPAPVVAAPAPAPVAPRAAAPKAPPPASSSPVAGAPAGASAADASGEVSATVRRWAGAWSSRDAAAYVNFYAPSFTGSAKSHDAWARERTERITQRSRIKVEVSDLVVSVIGDKAEVRFRQSYESDGPKETSRKVLNLVRSGGAWLITRETSGG